MEGGIDDVGLGVLFGLSFTNTNLQVLSCTQSILRQFTE